MKSDKPDYLIIGGSAAGMAAAQAIREKDAHGSITVLSDELDMPYYRPMIPYVVTGKKNAENIGIAGNGPYTAAGIEIRIGSRVESIDTARRAVSLNGKGQLTYGKLLLATGSSPFIPPEIEETKAPGVFALRKLVDARAMAQRAGNTKHAVMLGGGLLNLKGSFALLELGVKVTLVVFSPEILSQLMEPEDAVLIRRALEKAGLKIITGRSAKRIIADKNGVTGVALDDGTELSCQMVCIGKGVKPNTGFLKGSGITVEKGIVVDKYTTCNDANTFAAGDAAVTFDPITGNRIATALWTNAVEMGRCAGYNMAGVKTAYAGTFGIMNATQVADTPFVSMGIVHTKNTNNEVHVSATGSTYRKIVFSPDGNTLVGALFIGNIKAAGMYRYLIRGNMQVGRIKSHIIDQTLHYGHFLKS